MNEALETQATSTVLDLPMTEPIDISMFLRD
jgi:hypothetical protein